MKYYTMKVNIIFIWCIVSVKSNPCDKNTVNVDVNTTDDVAVEDKLTETNYRPKNTEDLTDSELPITEEPNDKPIFETKIVNDSVIVANIPELKPKVIEKIKVANITIIFDKPTERRIINAYKKKNIFCVHGIQKSSKKCRLLSSGSRDLFGIKGCPTGFDRSDSGECVEIEE